jgi:hypothetical protein
MKKHIITLLFAIGLGIAVLAPTEKPAQAQVVYCGHCCDRDVYGDARIRCTLVNAWPCGGTCECAGIAGYGFACY